MNANLCGRSVVIGNFFFPLFVLVGGPKPSRSFTPRFHFMTSVVRSPNTTTTHLALVKETLLRVTGVTRDAVPSLLVTAFFWLIEFPMLALYLHGPSFNGWAFWAGKSHDEICSTLTGVDAAHWRVHEAVCETLIYNRFQSHLWFIVIVLYFVLVVLVLQCTSSFVVRGLERCFCTTRSVEPCASSTSSSVSSLCSACHRHRQSIQSQSPPKPKTTPT